MGVRRRPMSRLNVVVALAMTILAVALIVTVSAVLQ